MCGEEVCVFTPWMLWIPLFSELCVECLDIWEELGRNKTLSLRVGEGGREKRGRGWRGRRREGRGGEGGFRGIFASISLFFRKAHAPLSHFEHYGIWCQLSQWICMYLVYAVRALTRTPLDRQLCMHSYFYLLAVLPFVIEQEFWKASL